ncbi:hypothetical protein EMCRGX_G008715 [Ephydatia muelleri]
MQPPSTVNTLVMVYGNVEDQVYKLAGQLTSVELLTCLSFGKTPGAREIRSGRKRPRRNDVESNALQIDETDETDQLKHLVGVGGSLTEKKKSRDDQAAQTEEVKLPAGEGDSTNEVELVGDEDNRTDEVRQPEGEDVRTDEVELRQGENYQDENMKQSEDCTSE